MAMRSERITLTNDFHHTEATVVARDGSISASAMKRAEQKLCGMKDCTCGSIRGKQTHELEQVDAQGSYVVVSRCA